MALTIDEMSARYVDAGMKEAAAKVPSLLVSADDHVDEASDLFDSLPSHIRERTGRPPARDRHCGGGASCLYFA